MALKFPADLRPMEARDLGYVLQTWMDSLFYSRKRRQRFSEWKAYNRARIEALLNAATVTVACAPETDGEALYGWAAGEGTALHYVFVRQTRRRGGLGTALVHDLMRRGVTPAVHTESTRDGKRFWQGAAGRSVHQQRGPLRQGARPEDAGRGGPG